MRTVKAEIGDKFRVTNAPDGYTFQDGVVVQTGQGGTPFETNAGTATNPTTVTGKLRTPDGTETAPTATRDATGIYYFDVTFTVKGKWYGRLVGTGTLVAADEICIDVAASAFDTP